MGKPTMLEQLVLGEVTGKNAAIHAYDKIIWTIRSGYLTLTFIGWSILLKSFCEGNFSQEATMNASVLSMLLLSAGLASGGFVIDLNYVRRKFRVIKALNNLTEKIKDCGGDPAQIPVNLLKVAGDDGDAHYDSKGYQEALHVGRTLYFCPLTFLVVISLIIILMK